MRRPLVFAALLLICVILALSAFGIPLTKTVREGTFLEDDETAEGTLRGTLSRLSYAAGGSVRLIIEDAEFIGESDVPGAQAQPSEGVRDGAEEGEKRDSGASARQLGTVLAYADTEPEAPLGSVLVLTGRLSLFPEPDNPGEFDQRAYRREENILLRFSADECRVETAQSGYPFREAARRVRKWLFRGLSAVFDEEDAGVMRALLLGDRSRLSDELEGLYESAGIRHVLTVSGLHVTLASGAFGLVFGWLLSFVPWQRLPGVIGRRGYSLFRGIFAGLAVCFYTELAGCGLPLRRAACMVLLYLLAAAARQSYDLLSALAFALIAAVLPCPYVLFQASFQMSFACVLVIGWIFPPLCRRLYMETPLGRAFLLPALLSLLTLPLQLRHYYVFHPLGFLGNLLVVPLVMWILIFGAAAAVLAQVFLPAGVFLAGPAHAALALVKGFCSLVRKLPVSTVVAGRPTLLRTVIYAVLAGIFLLLLARRRKMREEAALTLILTAGTGAVRRILRESRECVLLLILFGWALSAVFLIRPKEKGLTVTSLYVGQGDCHVIRAEGRTYLIDGGSAGGSPAASKILPYLKHEGIRRISFVMASHADDDHINGLAEVLTADGIRTEELVLSGWDRGSEKTAPLEQAAAEAGTAVRSVFEGDILSLDGVTFRVLLPARAESPDENDDSLVVLLSRKGFRALFTGDIGAEKEQEITARYGALLKDLDLLKAAHHGSRFSSCESFLKTSSPAVAVISCGRNNRYGHPHEETLVRLAECGAKILRTDRGGAVRISVNEENILTIETYKQYNYSNFEEMFPEIRRDRDFSPTLALQADGRASTRKRKEKAET